MSNELTRELLLEKYEYRNGALYNKAGRRAGERAGGLNSKGYRQICFKGRFYVEHRLIFWMHHGFLPRCIDHIDGQKENNRIENLRASSLSQNQHNSRISKNNTSGIKGVSWDKRSQKWVVQIKVNGKKANVGYFPGLEEAKEAARSVREKIHGEFARHERDSGSSIENARQSILGRRPHIALPA